MHKLNAVIKNLKYILQLNLEIQLSFFKEVASLLRQQLGDAEAEKLLRNAVYLSSNGGVDYFVLIGNHPNATEPLKREFVKLLLGNITNVVKVKVICP